MTGSRPTAEPSAAASAALIAREVSAALELIGGGFIRCPSPSLLVPERIGFTHEGGDGAAAFAVDFAIEAGPAGLRVVPMEASDGR